MDATTNSCQYRSSLYHATCDARRMEVGQYADEMRTEREPWRSIQYLPPAMKEQGTGGCHKDSEDPGLFLLEGGTILWSGSGLVGNIGGRSFAIRGDRSTMEQLEGLGRAKHCGNGFWTCHSCPHCGGPVTPHFSCCSEPYA